MDPQNYSLLNPNSNTSLTNTNFSLGNFQLPQVQMPNFGMPTALPNFSTNLQMPEFGLASSSIQPFSLLGDRSSSSVSQNSHSFFSKPLLVAQPVTAVAEDLTRETTVTLVGNQVPGLEKANFVLGTAKAGQTLSNNITKSLEAGESVGEAVLCQSLKTSVTEGLSALATDVIIGGVPAYLSAAVAYPPLALTIPLVGVALPHAYNNAQTIAQATGNVSEQICHDAFAAARQLSGGR